MTNLRHLRLISLINFLLCDQSFFSPILVYFHLAYARSVRRDPYGIHASNLGRQENFVNGEKEELKDDDLVSMDYTTPRRKPPIHN